MHGYLPRRGASIDRPSAAPLAPPVPAPDSGLMYNLAPYRIQVGDVLDVKLPLTPELNDEVTVRPDGHIPTALAEDEWAYGRTVPELTEALRRDYSRELAKPRITVVVKSFAPTRTYVAGEVATPGEYITVGPNLTLSQAIARAGGLKASAAAGKIFILRRGPHDEPQFFATRAERDRSHG